MSHPPPPRPVRVGILGATGAVGQRFVQLLAGHPWFVVHALGASDRSHGRAYADAVRTWILPEAIPPAVAALPVVPCEPAHFAGCDVVFSGLDSSVAGEIETAFIRSDFAVLSNARNHRMALDVPLVVPLVNDDHLALIAAQRQQRGLRKGFLVCNAKCSTTGLVVALKPLHTAFGIRECTVVTMQAVSGAGYPGVSSMDIIDNVIPYISGEEDKLETEPLKILGALNADRTQHVFAQFDVFASCNRVPVLDGHTESVLLRFERPVSVAQVEDVLRKYTCDAQRLRLPSAPAECVCVMAQSNRPQPRMDRNRGEGFTVSVGRVRPLKSSQTEELGPGVQFTLLSHNTILGAAGSAILNAELAIARGLVVLD